MKLNVYISLLILLLINFSTIAQDSVAQIRKPVLLYLLEQERVAVYYQQETNRLLLVIGNMKMKEMEYISIIESLKQDSTYSAAQIEIQKLSANSWRDLFEAEEKAHKRTKRVAIRNNILIATVATLIILLKN